jgi:hypothetical protein
MSSARQAYYEIPDFLIEIIFRSTLVGLKFNHLDQVLVGQQEDQFSGLTHGALSCTNTTFIRTKSRDQETNGSKGRREEVTLGGVNLISCDFLVIVFAFKEDGLGSEIRA